MDDLKELTAEELVARLERAISVDPAPAPFDAPSVIRQILTRLKRLEKVDAALRQIREEYGGGVIRHIVDEALEPQGGEEKGA